MPQLPRRRFLQSTALLGASLLAKPSSFASGAASSEIALGIIGCGGRGNQHLKSFLKISGVRITGLCDPDRKRLTNASELAPNAECWTDLRGMLESTNVDAVVIATCNHWHAIAAAWALEAGKHVYVEKPLCLTHWEGQQLMAASERFQKIVQVGTQQRSDPMQAELKQFLHDEQALGEIEYVIVNRYGARGPIGLRTKALKPPKSLDYNLWLGPAADVPIFRNSLHYDWHWVWNTGSGEMGNWGVHVLDDVRNVVFRDEVRYPKKIVAAGDRINWGDAGDTPNLQFVAMDAGGIPVVIRLCNLSDRSPDESTFGVPGPETGYVVFCEGGRLEAQRGEAIAFNKEGRAIRTFEGNTGEAQHRVNFLTAIRSNSPDILNGPINLPNIATMLSGRDETTKVNQMHESFGNLDILKAFQHMKAVSGGDQHFELGPILEFNDESESFIGDHSVPANGKLRRRDRSPFVMTDYLSAT
jgi:predicted dehydrogenase